MLRASFLHDTHPSRQSLFLCSYRFLRSFLTNSIKSNNKNMQTRRPTPHPRLLRLRPSSLPLPAAFPFPAALAAVFVFLATRLAPSSSTISTPVRYDVVFASLFSCWFHAFTSSGSSLCSFAFSLLSSAASTPHRGDPRLPWYLLPFLSAWSSMAGSSL